MTTSSAYAKEVPQWLRGLATTSPASRYFTSVWSPRDPALLARTTKLPDAAPGEDSNHGIGAAFPHALGDAKHPERAIQETPFADELVAHTVAAAIDALQLGRDSVPDLLAISFGAHDLAGHAWGPASWEVLDLTLRLDRMLGELFESLDARLGEHGWAAIVTSDHGATPLPERGRIRSARRVPPREIEDAAEAALAAKLGEGPWVIDLIAGNLYLTPGFLELPEDVRSAALDAAEAAVMAVPGVAFVGRTDRLSADCKAEKAAYKAICNARVHGVAGELYVYPAAGSVITSAAFGTGHDAPFDDNRQVPILVKAPGVPAQQGTGTQLQIAPTIAALLGVAPPSRATEPTLFGIKRRE